MRKGVRAQNLNLWGIFRSGTWIAFLSKQSSNLSSFSGGKMELNEVVALWSANCPCAPEVPGQPTPWHQAWQQPCCLYLWCDTRLAPSESCLNTMPPKLQPSQNINTRETMPVCTVSILTWFYRFFFFSVRDISHSSRSLFKCSLLYFKGKLGFFPVSGV